MTLVSLAYKCLCLAGIVAGDFSAVWYTGSIQWMYWLSICGDYVIWFYQHASVKTANITFLSAGHSLKLKIAKTYSLYPSLGHACMSDNALRVRQYYICIKNLVQDSKDGAMTVFCNIQDHIKNNFKVFICYLICPNKYNAYIRPWKWFFYYLFWAVCVLANCLLHVFPSKCRIVPEVYKLIPGSIQPSTWLQLNKLLMKLWKGVSRTFTLFIRCKFGYDDADD